MKHSIQAGGRMAASIIDFIFCATRRGVPAIVVFFIMVIFGSCATSNVSVPAQGIPIPADFAGVAHVGKAGTQEEFDHAEYAGVKWTIRSLSWGDVESNKGEWDFQNFDNFFKGINDAGIKLIGILAYSNKVYNDVDKNRYIDSNLLPYFLEYVRQMTERYKGKVDAWCIWNEPNMKYFWRGTQEDFFELTRETARVIREVDSEVLILGGAFNRIFTMPEKFIRGLFESGAMEQVDIIAFHPYELNPARAAKAYNRFKDIVADYGYQDKIWVTEIGYPTGGLYPTRVSEKRFPEYIIKTWVLLTASGANKIIWYQMFDPHERERFDSEDYFGLTRSNQDFTSKGLEAFRLCANYIPDSVCYMQDDIEKSLRIFWFKKNDGSGGGAVVIWNEGIGSKQVTIKLPGIGHLQHNIVTGSSDSISPEIQIKAGRDPVFITWKSE